MRTYKFNLANFDNIFSRFQGNLRINLRMRLTWQYWTVSEKRRAKADRLTSCFPLERDLSRIVVLDLRMGGTKLLVWVFILSRMVIVVTLHSN